jgi:hypothetical protein
MPAVGVCGKTGPAEIHRIPAHSPAGVAPMLGSGVGVGFGGVVAIADELAEGDGCALFGDGEAAATEQPASSHAAARPIAKTLRRPDRVSWWFVAMGLIDCSPY